MEHKNGTARVWQQQVTIPTYEVGAADKNPMFLEKRVYQGSTGKVYPCPVVDKIYDEKADKAYTAVFLENDYLLVMILPELGGRIQRAYDKTNGYDFVYYNEVIKPALVGLAGPWVSGGIEFNWPQHHRPTTFSPVDFDVCQNPDGSATCRVNETDQMYGTKALASFTLHPGKAYIEIEGQLYNPTPLPQTFLWWANPAVAVNDDTQSIFPPDVTAVMDHGKRAVSKFPIATGEYYKHDYSAGVDISRYKNIPVPTSYMAYHSDYNFVGGYDYGVEAGILHIADHHISPGKKQWTWGSGDFGKAWDRNLTDENGPYIELMTGVYTDNQPDFTWLKPFEEKRFTQYFMPYKKAGNAKNASVEAVMNLEVEGKLAGVCVYATARYENARVVLRRGGEVLFEQVLTLSPTDILSQTVPVGEAAAHELTLELFDSAGRRMLAYTPAAPAVEKTPEPAKAAKDPGEIASNEELYLTGLHIEQYRHATYLPDGYYLEGLKRDAGDSRINTAYGQLLLRRGLFAGGEEYLRRAVARLTEKNPNPYTGEAHYNLGLSLWYQQRWDEAFDAFYKATWTSAEQEMGYYYLAAISARRGEVAEALDFIERSLVKNSHNLKARGLKAVLLRLAGEKAAAQEFLAQTLALDGFDYLSRFELYGFEDEKTLALARGNAATFLAVATCYMDWGRWAEAVHTLRACTGQSPLLAYYEAYAERWRGDEAAARAALERAAACSPLYCFPNKLEDIAVLQYAMAANPADARVPYYLGNLWYDKRQYTAARECWERSVEADPTFPTAWRNLSLAYYNKEGEPGKARAALERAFELDRTDARVFLELDQLYKKLRVPPAVRLENYENNAETFAKRDDLVTEYVTLLNLVGRFEQAHARTMAHKFHPWEGGEGKITTQYTLSLVEMAKAALAQANPQKAKELLVQALAFPANLGEGKLEGAKDNHVYYYLGCACEALGDAAGARENFEKATLGGSEPAGMMYYNDQPADLILYKGLALQKLGRPDEAAGCYHKLVDYGEQHSFDEVRIEYFAVSLPDLVLFDEDLNLRNKAHCHYLIALGSYGLGEATRAVEACRSCLEIDPAHIGAVQHMRLFLQ